MQIIQENNFKLYFVDNFFSFLFSGHEIFIKKKNRELIFNLQSIVRFTNYLGKTYL